MDIQQRYEVLCQIARDYGLLEHMEHNRTHYQRALGLDSMQVGHDLALVETLVHGEGLYPVNYVLAQRRAAERLGLLSESDEGR
jgi:hypothetical protein